MLNGNTGSGIRKITYLTQRKAAKFGSNVRARHWKIPELGAMGGFPPEGQFLFSPSPGVARQPQAQPGDVSF